MQAFIVSRLSRTSNLVIQRVVTEFIKITSLSAFKSSQPHLLGLPVVAPNSFPILEISSAVESNNSVGNGPSPTLVVYAFEMPRILSINFGPTPRPEDTPPAVVLEDVT